MPNKTLRLHQDASVTAVTTTAADYLVDKPTGSGKTVEIVAVTAVLVAAGQKVVIGTTQRHIEQAFTARDYDALVRTDGRVLACPPGLTRPARAEGGAIRAVLTYLAADAAPPGYAVVCTHAALGLIDQPAGDPPSVALPATLTGCVLLVDEAHHASAAGLAQLVELWRRRGGRVVFYTATAFRHDGDPVLLGPHPVTGERMRVFRRTLAQHMEEGFAPGRVDTELVAIRTEVVSREEFNGTRAPTTGEVRGLLVDQMVARWMLDSRPKLVVRVPVMQGAVGDQTATADLVARTVAAFQAAGARVLDLSGQSPADKTRFLAALPDERAAAAYRDSVFDVLVGVQRVSEGMDWPLCSTVYAVGLPASLVLLTQLLGRATRHKGQAGFPTPEAGRAKLVCFVPCGEPSADLVAYHRRTTVLVCAHLENATSAAEWAVVKTVGRGLIEPLSDRDATAAAQAAYAEVSVDPLFRAEALAVFAKIRHDLLAAKSMAPDVEVLQRAYAELPSIPRAVLRQVLVEYICGQTDQANAKGRDRVRRSLLEELAAAREKGDDLVAAFRAAFDKVVIDLDSVAVCHGAELGRIHQHVVRLTGQSIREIGGRLADARPLTPEWLGEAVAAHKEEHGTFPTARTPGHAPGWPEETWAKLDADIGGRRRGWPLAGVPSLSAFVSRYAARGAVGAALDEFRRAARLCPAEVALLNALAAQRVEIGGHVLAFGHTPFPAVNGWPAPQWWVLREWWARGWPKVPLADLYAAALVNNLAKWLGTRGQNVPQPVRAGDLAPAYARYAAAGLVLCPPEAWEGTDGTVYHAGRRFGVSAARVGSPHMLTRRDGARPFDRAGYAEAVVTGQVVMSGAGRPALTGDVAGPATAFPLAWVVEVGDKAVGGWDRVRDAAGEPLARPAAA